MKKNIENLSKLIEYLMNDLSLNELHMYYVLVRNDNKIILNLCFYFETDYHYKNNEKFTSCIRAIDATGYDYMESNDFDLTDDEEIKILNILTNKFFMKEKR